MLNQELVQYVEGEIIPRYASFDGAHREDHVRKVIEEAMNMSAYYPDFGNDSPYLFTPMYEASFKGTKR